MVTNRYFRLLYCIFGITILIGVDAYSQAVEGRWAALSNGPVAQGRHDDVVFINENEGWVANLTNEVYRTQDAGATWDLIHFDEFGPRYRSVVFANDRIGYLGSLTRGKVLYQTFDGGHNWINISSRIKGAPDAICGLWAVDAQHIYGVGAFFGGPWFVKTDDGGQTWTSKKLGNGAKALVDVYFQNKDVGFAVGGTANADSDFLAGGEAVVLRTTDGGSNWSLAHRTNRNSNVVGEWGWKISFPSELVGYVSVEYNGGNGEPAKYLKTVDGGLTWTEHYIPGSTRSAGLQGIGFISEDIGWASGRGQTSVTYDGGSTWSQIADYNPQINPDGELDGRTNRIFIVNGTTAYAVGKYTYKFDGTIPVNNDIQVIAEQPAQFSMKQNFPNPFRENTTIEYSLFEPVDVRITVIDVIGRQVRTLFRDFQSPGAYTLTWDGRDDGGNRLAAGNYLYLMDIGEHIEMKRAVLLR